MIDVKELRIGNLVYKVSREHYEHQIEIKHLSVDKDTSHFNPIPLTEEWCKNLGFSKLTNHTYGRKIFNETLLEVFIQYGHIGIQIMSEVQGMNNYSNSITAVKYVHQLQNLYFSLTCEELILDN